MNKIKLIKIL